MDNEKNTKDELREVAPGFPDMPSYDVPDGYFDKLPGQVLNQWKKDQSQFKTKRIIRWTVSIAALVCGLLIGNLWWNKPHQSLIAPISSTEAYLYIEENIEEFGDLLEEQQVISETKELNIPSEEIDDYLLEEMETNPEDLF